MLKHFWRMVSGANAVTRLETDAEQARERAVRAATLNEDLREAFKDYRDHVIQLTIESMAELIDREVQSRLVEYYNGGYHAGLREGWTAAKNSQVFPAVDGPARAEARRIFESRGEGHPPMTKAELREELGRRLGEVSGKSVDRVWRDMRAEHPQKTKGPGRRKNTAPISN
jgi:hypothetical protein